MPIDDIEYNPQFMIYDEITNSKSISAFCALRKLVLEWVFSSALQSGDRRKIKRAKRKYKAAKRELRRIIQNDS